MKVLATGLSGLYSSLPTKLDVPNEEWHCLHREDWQQLPALVQFLNSLEFCNAVIQVCASAASFLLHLGFIYSGDSQIQSSGPTALRILYISESDTLNEPEPEHVSGMEREWSDHISFRAESVFLKIANLLKKLIC